jgi:hypothetical protein
MIARNMDAISSRICTSLECGYLRVGSQDSNQQLIVDFTSRIVEMKNDPF